MANNTFTNTSGGTWSTSGNWSLGSIPDSNTLVTFVSGTYTSTVDGSPWTIQSLNVNVATVTLQIGVDLTTQTLDNAGSIVVAAGANLSAGSLNSNSGTISVTDNAVFTVQNLNGNSGNIVAASNGLVNLLSNGTGNFTVSGGVLKIAGNFNGNGTITMNVGSIWLAGQLGNSAYSLDNGGVDQAYFDSLQPTTNNAFTGADVGDRLAIKGVTINSAIHSGTTLTLNTTGGTFTFTNITLAPGVEPNGTIGTTTFEGNSYGYIELACFAGGTCIDTPDGSLPVEMLRKGMLVLTGSGGARPIRWIGYRYLDLLDLPNRALAQPIRIVADAFAPGVPRGDVLVSPDHALMVKGVLVPARLLINGATIRRENTSTSVSYYHVELDSHDVILAEGLAVESYLDTGNRGMFENAEPPLSSHPEANDQALRQSLSCVPFVADAGYVRPLWQELAEYARDLGYVLPQPVTTDNPALRLDIGGLTVQPTHVAADRCNFALSRTLGAIRLISHAMIPSELFPWIEDRRRLGVMVRSLTLRRDGKILPIPLDHPWLGKGWWAVEDDGHSQWRWTDGAAELALEPGGPAQLDVEFGTMPAYASDGELLGDDPFGQRAVRIEQHCDADRAVLAHRY